MSAQREPDPAPRAPLLIDLFEQRYGLASLHLAAHAAVAHRLRPELVALIRTNFLPGPARLQPAHDADVLFGPLCTEHGGGFFEMQSEVKSFLVRMLDWLYRDPSRDRYRSQDVARMLRYYFDASESNPRYETERYRQFKNENLWRLIALDDPDTARRFIFEHAENRNAVARDALGTAPRGAGIISVTGEALALFQEDFAYLAAQDMIADGHSEEGQMVLELLADADLSHGDKTLTPPTALLAEERTFQRRRQNMGSDTSSEFGVSTTHASSQPAKTFGDALSVDPDRFDLDDTPLTFATLSGDLEAVKLALANAECDINQLDRFGLSALHHAARLGHEEIGLTLIEAGAEIDQHSVMKTTPLFYCGDQGMVGLARALLAKGADLLHVNAKGSTAFMGACHFGNGALIDLFLETGLIDTNHINTPNDEGYLPLYGALLHGNEPVFEQLLSLGATIPAPKREGYTFLHAAVTGRSVRLVERVLEEGYTVDPLLPDGWSPLLMACGQFGSDEVVRLLLECGADPWRKTRYGWSPEKLAAYWDHPDILDILNAEGKPIGPHLFADAASAGAAKSMAHLIDRYGLKPGKKSADMVAQAGSRAGVEFLFERPDLFDAEHRKVFALAVKAAKPEVIKLFRERGWPTRKTGSKADWFASLSTKTDDWAAAMEALLDWPELREQAGDQIFKCAVEFANTQVIARFRKMGWDVPPVEKDKPGWCWAIDKKELYPEDTILALLEWEDMPTRSNTGQVLLVDAVNAGQRKVIEALIARGVDLDEADKDYVRPLGAALASGNGAILERLLAQGANPHLASGSFGYPIIFDANPNDMDLLIRQGVDILARGAGDATILHAIAGQQEPSDLVAQAKAALSFGVGVDLRDASGQTALHIAARFGRSELVEFLIEMGAMIDACDNFGHTPMLRSLSAGRSDIATHLLERGARANFRATGGWSALHIAASRGNVAEISRFWPLLGGKDIAAEEPARTVLQVAAESGAKEVVSELLKLGVAPDSGAGSTPSPLHLAVTSGWYDVAQTLIEADARKDIVEVETGLTLLQRIDAAKSRLTILGQPIAEELGALESLITGRPKVKPVTPASAKKAVRTNAKEPAASTPILPKFATADPVAIPVQKSRIASSAVFITALENAELGKKPDGWEVLKGSWPGKMLRAAKGLGDKYQQSPIGQFVVRGLPFYDDVQLIRLRSRGWKDDPHALFFLTLKGKPLWLNGASLPIHEVNAKAPVRITRDIALDYLRFFCFFVHGKEGPFYLVDSWDDPNLAPLLEARPDTRETPLMPVEILGEDQKGFHCRGTVSYSNALFSSEFRIQPGGMVEMLEDQPILAGLPVKLSMSIK